MTKLEAREWLKSMKSISSNREEKSKIKLHLMMNLDKPSLLRKTEMFITTSNYYSTIINILKEEDYVDQRPSRIVRVDGYALRSYVCDSI